MDKEFILGLMVENMKELMKMIKNMDLAFIVELMEEDMKVIGLMVNSMEVDSLFKEIKRKKEFGIKEKELSGLMIVKKQTIIKIRKNSVSNNNKKI